MRGRPTTSSARSSAYHFFATQKNSTLHCASSPPKKLRFLGTPKEGGVPLPILLRKTGMIGLRHTTKKVGDGLDRPAKIEYTNGRVKTRPYINYPNNISNTIGAKRPETCHLQLCCSFHLRRGEVRGRPTTPQFDFNPRLKLYSYRKQCYVSSCGAQNSLFAIRFTEF